MRFNSLKTLFALATLSLTVAAAGCGDLPPSAGDPDDDDTRETNSAPSCLFWGGGPETISYEEMQHLYYDINPTPHAEKAYQASDPSPPVSSRPTYPDSNGSITVLQTKIYNRYCAGCTAHFAVHSPSGTVMCRGSGVMPFRYEIPNVVIGRGYYIQSLTVGTMAKILPTNLAQ